MSISLSSMAAKLPSSHHVHYQFSLMIPIRYNLSTNLVSKSSSNLVLIALVCSESGTSPVPIWCGSGVSLVPAWYQPGTALVLTG